MKSSYTTADLNPRSAAVTQMRMTVQRALDLVAAFDELEPGLDWQDVPGATYRKIIGERYQFNQMLSECWNRYKSGRFFTEILDLAANLPPSDQKKFAKQLKDIERRAADVAARRRSRSSRGRKRAA